MMVIIYSTGDDIMTTINCSSNCIHQEDGKCMLDHTHTNSISSSSDCIFFKERCGKQPNTQNISYTP